ncbi:condensation domain-containing protein, partial [Janthinobacterium sp. PSPC1-1]|uniref:condensation domain-containing protein n=1 Tax=Janthinobacterium sp. PSPC1-1 TaxID=2804581 RepID=UPI003CECEB7E
MPVTDRPPNVALSFSQQRLWFLDQLEQGSAHYNMPAALRVTGHFDVALAQQAFARIIARHEPLRTVFASAGEEPWQVIREQVDFALAETDLRQLAGVQQEQAVQEAAAADAATPFDLASDVMLRVRFLRLGSDAGVLLFNMHHIASDGWSMGVLVKEFAAQYAALAGGAPDPLPPLAIRYADYAQWQREWLSGAVLDEQLDYWQRQLADLPPVHGLPLDHARPAQASYAGARHVVTSSVATQQGLRRLAQREQA